ncbi:MAG: right-handed parallel beta-helix repeat-containing protein [bacterium]|nr:right-handed parallel beta-helix repeat-containing protein [bacterium]
MNKLIKHGFIISISCIVLISIIYAADKAQAVSTETLIKGDNSTAIYYLGNDSRRYVFPNETVFFSWYQNFDSVEQIKQTQLSDYPLGGNITVRPGTNLVKITTSPSVYVVEPGGVLKKIRNEAQAQTLFGADWSRRVIDVSDALFSNYTVSGELSEGSIPAGSLVRSSSSSAIYYYDGLVYRHISDMTALRANRFDLKYTLALSVNANSFGQNINGREPALLAQIQQLNPGAQQNITEPQLITAGHLSERLVHAQSFVIPSNTVNGDTVGQLTTFWKELEKRSLIYTIINDAGVFAINNNGLISVKNASKISGDSITIRIKATDSTMNLSQEADMRIRIVSTANTKFIDPSAKANGDGTRANPYNTWAGVNISSNKNYLQRRGTEISLSSRINIGGNSSVIIGAYGAGPARPKVNIYNLVGGSNAAVSMTGDNNTVRDLDIDAKLSITGIYSGGGDNNTVDSVRIQNSAWGLRTMNAATGFRILNSEIAYTGDDGHYSQNHDNMEIAHNYIHHVNQSWNENSYWYNGKNEPESPGDGIQLNGSILKFNIHHNIIDRTHTGNKFCVIISPRDNSNSQGLLEYNHCTLRPSGRESGFYIAGNVTGAKIRYNTLVNQMGIYSHSRDLVISNNTFVNARLYSQYQDNKFIFDNEFINN